MNWGNTLKDMTGFDALQIHPEDSHTRDWLQNVRRDALCHSAAATSCSFRTCSCRVFPCIWCICGLTIWAPRRGANN